MSYLKKDTGKIMTHSSAVQNNLPEIFPKSFVERREVLPSNGLVADGKVVEKFNLSLPMPLMEEFNKHTEGFPRGRKQTVLSAAVLMFLEASEKDREQYIGRVGSAMATGNYTDLVSPLRPPGSISFKRK